MQLDGFQQSVCPTVPCQLKRPRHAVPESPCHRSTARKLHLDIVPRWRLPTKYKFIAAISRTAVKYLCETKSVLCIPLGDLLKRSSFIGISADPIDPVVPAAHATRGNVVIVGPSPQPVFCGAAPIMVGKLPHFGTRDNSESEQKRDRTGQRIVALLNASPAVSDRALVVVNRDEELRTDWHQGLHIFQRLPHRTGVVQHA